MEHLIGLAVAVIAVLFGVDFLKNRQARTRASGGREEMREREVREAEMLGRTRARVDAIEEDIKERGRGDEVSKDTPARAADRLRDEFGASGDD